MKHPMAILSICFVLISVCGIDRKGQLTAATYSRSRPNIIVILCDDLGYGDLASYGHPHIKTPVLDQMAKDGVRLTDCYAAAPVCSPSRVGLLTGRSPNRAGVYNWIPWAGKPKANAREQVHMRESEVTIPALLKKAGYATAMAGKWHCNGIFNNEKQPQPDDFGFDHWFATQNNAGPSHRNPNNFVRNGEPVGPTEGYSCQIVVDEAVHWLEGQLEQSPEQPFFMYLAFHETHERVASPPELVAGYMDVVKEKVQAEYFANVENVDKAVGKLLAALKRLDQDEETLVIFTSDNGPQELRRYKGAERSWGVGGPLRGWKLWTTEAGVRVPGIMRWPGTIRPNQVVSHPVSSLDFLPTFCELAGTKPPDDLELDGTVFLPALENKPLEREKPLFWAYYKANNPHRVAMRDGQWKILAKLNGGKFKRLDNVHDGNIEAVRSAELTDFQLFRLSNDVGEAKDVSDLHPKEFAAMKAKLTTAYQEMANTAHYWTRTPATSEAVADKTGPAKAKDATGEMELVSRLLDDFEDGDTNNLCGTNEITSTNGVWQVKGDQLGVTKIEFKIEETKDKDGKPTKAFHATGIRGASKPPSEWAWAVAESTLSKKPRLNDLRPSVGISFMVKSARDNRMGIQMAGTVAGKAIGATGATHRYHFKTGEEWREVKIFWHQFFQPEYVCPGEQCVGPLTVDKMEVIVWSPFGEGKNFDFWLDDVEFLYEKK